MKNANMIYHILLRAYIVKLFLKVLAMLFKLEDLHLLLALVATLVVVVVVGGEGWQGGWTSGR